ncbi:hypothetical protein MY7_0362 [Bacillus sp. 5B6]|nr:hypothetical protein MY7_0362 [Bacillus sp. 5B6]
MGSDFLYVHIDAKRIYCGTQLFSDVAVSFIFNVFFAVRKSSN